MVVDAADADAVLAALREAGETANIIGEIVEDRGERVVLNI